MHLFWLAPHTITSQFSYRRTSTGAAAATDTLNTPPPLPTSIHSLTLTES